MISVKLIKDSTFKVTVESKTTTQHEVHVENNFYQALTKSRIGCEDLIKLSFEFLLEREPNTSILSRFDLQIISQYFPEYESEIKKRFKS